MKVKLSKGTKLVAKFNALKLASMQLNQQCNAHDTFYEMDGVADELKDAINLEVSKIVKQLNARAEKLDKQYSGKLVDIVDVSQSI